MSETRREKHISKVCSGRICLPGQPLDSWTATGACGGGDPWKGWKLRALKEVDGFGESFFVS